MKKFRVVVADPPWAFSDKLKMSDVKRGAEANYRTLTIADICKLPVADWVEKDSILALWTPSSLLTDGMRVMESWGFKQKQIYTWVKETKRGGIAFGMGRQFRGATEHALIGTRGSPKPASKSERNVDLWVGLPHSKKPERLQERLEKMYPDGPYLELFARRSRPGWTCFGNEAPGFKGIDVREWSPFAEGSV
jgi:N6-adenosine-specific RNA methylase IME4